MALSRREFLFTTAAALGAMALPRPRLAAAPPGIRKILGFSKPFLQLGPTATADLVSEVGWDGIDCPIRATLSQVRPERIEDDLPPFVEALRRNGKSIEVVTTDIVRLDARAEKILRTLAHCGIRTYRYGFVYYSPDQPPDNTLREFASAVSDLGAINRELGLHGGYQNHSGANMLGATMWELKEAFQGLDPAAGGICYDIGQAMIEGGLSWPTQMRLLRSRWLAIQVKDFIWDPHTANGWDAVWVPLGQGRLSANILRQIGAREFQGPIIQHHEHLEPGTPLAQLIPELKKEFATLREWLA
jgi:L-ribulose-5-phosphate 3-epimerase